MRSSLRAPANDDDMSTQIRTQSSVALPNVQDEPRPWLARSVLLGARIVTAMVVGSGALLGRLFGFAFSIAQQPRDLHRRKTHRVRQYCLSSREHRPASFGGQIVESHSRLAGLLFDTEIIYLAPAELRHCKIGNESE